VRCWGGRGDIAGESYSVKIVNNVSSKTILVFPKLLPMVEKVWLMTNVEYPLYEFKLLFVYWNLQHVVDVYFIYFVFTG